MLRKKVYETTSSLKKIDDLNSEKRYSDCVKTGYFTQVKTTMETDKSKTNFYVSVIG